MSVPLRASMRTENSYNPHSNQMNPPNRAASQRYYPPHQQGYWLVNQKSVKKQLLSQFVNRLDNFIIPCTQSNFKQAFSNRNSYQMPLMSTYEPVKCFCISDSTIVIYFSLPLIFRNHCEIWVRYIFLTVCINDPFFPEISPWDLQINFSVARLPICLLLTAIFLVNPAFFNKILHFGFNQKKRRTTIHSRQNNIARCLFHGLMLSYLYKLASLDW